MISKNQPIKDSIFVTGGTGFIGQHLIKKLHSNVRLLSRRIHPKYDTVVCDLSHDSIPDDVLDGVDTVVHLAGFAHDMRDANKCRKLYQKINVEATVQLAKLAVKSGVSRFVFLSSVKAGGNSFSSDCLTEDCQRCPEGVYGETKREAEIELLKIGKESSMRVSIIRSSLVYGPNVKGNLEKMFLGIKRGWFPPLPETKNKKSLIHVDDLVKAILLVTYDSRANGEIFIATDGRIYSSREIYTTLCNIAERPVPNWSVPKILFKIASLLSPRIKYKVDKLLGDECYSSEKLEALGFRADKTLKEMNETDF